MTFWRQVSVIGVRKAKCEKHAGASVAGLEKKFLRAATKRQSLRHSKMKIKTLFRHALEDLGGDNQLQILVIPSAHNQPSIFLPKSASQTHPSPSKPHPLISLYLSSMGWVHSSYRLPPFWQYRIKLPLQPLSTAGDKSCEYLFR